MGLDLAERDLLENFDPYEEDVDSKDHGRVLCQLRRGMRMSKMLESSSSVYLTEQGEVSKSCGFCQERLQEVVNYHVHVQLHG